MRDLEMNKKLFGVQVHSTVGKTAPNRQVCREHYPWAALLPHRRASWRLVFGHGEGYGGNSRGTFAHPGRAHGPLLDPAQTLLTEDPLTLGGHAVHVEVVQQQRLCVLAQGIGLDHTLCEHAWVLSAEEKLDPWYPVLADQEGWPSCGRWETEGNTQWGSPGWSTRFQPGSEADAW